MDSNKIPFLAIILFAFACLTLSYLSLKGVIPLILKRNAEKTQIPLKTKVKEFKIPIIIYHYVEVVTDKKDFIRKSLSITPEEFESQIRYLQQKGYQTIFVKEIPNIVSGKINLGNNLIALNFDDGYRDFYTDVYPILLKYKIKATVYIVPAFIGGGNYMTQQQIKEIYQSGLVEIGAHTLNHIDLPSVSLEDAQKEIIESKEYIENTFGVSVESFCYPYGFYNDKIVSIVKAAGYTTAVSEALGTTQSANNLFYLSRMRVGYFYTII